MNKDCELCGYPICRRGCVQMNTKFKGKTAHVGCVESWIKGRIKTAKMLNVPKNDIKEWIRF